MSESPFTAGTLPADDIAADAEQRRHRLFATADQLRLAGRGMEALHVLAAEIATSRGGERHRAHLLGRLAQTVALEQPTIALAGLREALNLRLDARSRSTVLALVATIAARTGHPDTDALLREAGTAHAASGDQSSARHLALGRAARSLAYGDLPGAQAVLAALDPDSWAARADASSIRAERVLVQLGLGRHQDARTATRRAPDEADVSRTGLTALDCLRMVAVGELPEAAALAVTALSSGSADLSSGVRALLVAVIGEVRYRRGEHDDARAILRTCLAEERWPDRTMWSLAFCVAVRDPALSAPAGLLTRIVADLHRSVRPLLPVPHVGPRLVRAAVAAGDTLAARRVTELVELVSTRTPVPLWHALADQSRGCVTATRTRSGRRSTSCAPPPLGRRWPTRCSISPTVLGCDPGRRAMPRTRRLPSTPGSAPRATRRLPTDAAPTSPPPRAIGSRSTGRQAGASARSPPPRSGWPRCSPPAPRRRRRPGASSSRSTPWTPNSALYHKLGINNRMQLARAWERTRR